LDGKWEAGSGKSAVSVACRFPLAASRPTITSAPTGQGAMHFRHPVHAASSMRSPSRRMWMAPGGQSGMHKPHASQSAASTIATSVEGARGIAQR
jgi:hypothetical protein